MSEQEKALAEELEDATRELERLKLEHKIDLTTIELLERQATSQLERRTRMTVNLFLATVTLIGLFVYLTYLTAQGVESARFAVVVIVGLLASFRDVFKDLWGYIKFSLRRNKC